jgi:hypothetical protein
MADMRQIFTYPDNAGTDYIDPDYIGNSTSGLTRRIDELLAGTYRAWLGLDPVSDLGTTTSETMQNISKFKNYYNHFKHASHISRYDFTKIPLIYATRGPRAANVSIVTADTLDPATITTGYNKTVTHITTANPGVVTTSTAHGFSTGDIIELSGVVGMTEVNGQSYTITVITNDTFFIDVDTFAFTPYTSGGVALIGQTHEFEDGMIIQIDGFDGTWGVLHNNQEFYCKRINSMQMQAAYDSALVNMVGFQQQVTISFIDDELSYEFAIGSAVQINFASAGVLPPANTRVVFNTVTNNGSGIVGNDYYLKSTGVGNYYQVFKDENTLVDPLMMSDIIPLTNEVTVTSFIEGNPLKIVVPTQLTTEQLKVYVNTPVSWSDDIYHWNSDQIYYLKTTADVYEYEVYTDSSYTTPVVIQERFTPSDPYSPTYNPGWMHVQPAMASPGGGVGPGDVTMLISSNHHVDDGDAIICGTITSSVGLNGGDALSGNTYYLKYRDSTVGESYNELGPSKTYELYKDSALTTKLTIADLTLGSYTSTIELVENNTIIQTKQHGLTPQIDTYTKGVGNIITKVVVNVANPDFGWNVGDTLDWNPIASNGDLQYGQLINPTSGQDGQFAWSSEITLPEMQGLFTNGGTTRYSSVWMDKTLNTNSQFIDTAPYTPYNKVTITDVEKNGKNLIGTDCYVYAPYYGPNNEVQLGFSSTEFTATNIQITDTGYQKSGAPNYGSVIGSVDVTSELNNNDLAGTSTNSPVFASGNTHPGPWQGGEQVKLTQVIGNPLRYTVERIFGWDNRYYPYNWNPQYKTYTPYDSYGVYTDLNQTYVELNTSTFPVGTTLSVDSGNYITASSVFGQDVIVDSNEGNGWYRVTDTNNNPIPASNWNVSDDTYDKTYTLFFDTDRYKFKDQDGDPVYPLYDIAFKLRNASPNTAVTDIIGDLSVDTPYTLGTDGVLYTNNTKTTPVIQQYDKIHIDEIVNAADHSFFPVGSTSNNRLWTTVIEDDGNNVVLNDPTNQYYGAFTLDDSTELDLDLNVIAQVTGVTQLPFNRLKFKGDYSNPSTEIDPGPINISLVGQDPTTLQPMTLNGKKLYKFVDWDPLWCSSLDTGIVGTFDDYKPYMFKTYQNQVFGNFRGTRVPEATIGSMVAMKIPIASGNKEWLMINADGFDTGVTPPAINAPRCFYANHQHPLTGADFFKNSNAVQEFPNVNKRATQATGIDFGNIFGFHCPISIGESGQNDYRPIDDDWQIFSYARAANWGAPTSSNPSNFPQGGTGHFSIGSTTAATRKFTIPKLAKYTINNLDQIRAWRSNDSGLGAPQRITVTVDDTVTGNNPFHGFFNSGDIIQSGDGAAKYILIKSHDAGSWITESTDSWQTDAIQGSYGWFFDIDDYNGSNKQETWIEGEEWFMVRYYDNGVPSGAQFEDIVGIKGQILDNAVVPNYPGTPPGMHTGVWFMEANDTFLNQGGTGWTLLAENIATQNPIATPDALYDTVYPEADFELGLYAKDLVGVEYKSNSGNNVGAQQQGYQQILGETTTTALETLSNNFHWAPNNMGEVKFKRAAWRKDNIEVKPWVFGQMYWEIEQANRVVIDITPKMSPIFTDGGTATLGFESSLNDATTGTVKLGPSEPNKYEIKSMDLMLPGNETYTYQDINNVTQFGVQVNYDKWWEAGATFESNLDDYPDQISHNASPFVDVNGRLAGIGYPSALGFYNNQTDMIFELENKTDEYVPPVPTTAELQDVYNTYDEWTDYGFSELKVWPYHVSPSSASIVYNSPTMVNNSQNGIKYTRGAGYTKWVLEVEYPPMKADDFREFNAIAQAAQGQSMPFNFKLRNKDEVSLLWADMGMITDPNSFEASAISGSPVGSRVLFLEGLPANEPFSFAAGEVFIGPKNQNGALHTSIGDAASNAFGETKVRLPWPLNEEIFNGNKVYKNPAWAVVTLNSDNFEYSVDVNGYYNVTVAFDLDDWK